MIEINLIPDVKLELLKARRQRRAIISVAVIITIVAVGITVLLAMYAFGVQTIASKLADNSITSENDKLRKVEDLSKTLTIQKQLASLSQQHDDKNLSSRVFDILTTTVPTGTNAISVTRLTMNTEDKTIEIEGQAANGYEALEVFKKTIAETKFEYTTENEVQSPLAIATSISDGERRYSEDSTGKRVLSFTMSFSYPEELFQPTSENGRIIGPNQQNATDSANGVPNSLFTNPARSEGSN